MVIQKYRLEFGATHGYREMLVIGTIHSNKEEKKPVFSATHGIKKQTSLYLVQHIEIQKSYRRHNIFFVHTFVSGLCYSSLILIFLWHLIYFFFTQKNTI